MYSIGLRQIQANFPQTFTVWNPKNKTTIGTLKSEKVSLIIPI